MKNTTELREEMRQVFMQLKNNEIDMTCAKVMVASANVMIKSAIAEHDYSKYRGNKEKIEFLETPRTAEHVDQAPELGVPEETPALPEATDTKD